MMQLGSTPLKVGIGITTLRGSHPVPALSTHFTGPAGTGPVGTAMAGKLLNLVEFNFNFKKLRSF